MCRSMADIQSTGLRLGEEKKEDERKKETTGQKYQWPALFLLPITVKCIVALFYSFFVPPCRHVSSVCL